MTALTEPTRVSDVVSWEVDEKFCREFGTFTNDTGAAADFEVGTVCEGAYNPADGTTFGGVLLKRLEAVADNGTVANVPFLVRGPARVNQDKLSWDAGATQATVRAAMETALILMEREPTQTTEG